MRQQPAEDIDVPNLNNIAQFVPVAAVATNLGEHGLDGAGEGRSLPW
jgi:hypothetical protein